LLPGFLADAAETRTPEEKESDKAYIQRYKDAIVINSLMPTSVGVIGNTVESFTDGVERNRRAGVTHASASIGAFHPEDVMFRNIIDTDPVIEKLGLSKARTTQDIRDAKANNRMTITYNS
jgi:membrane dipeptidase